jgi:hypothetical protein
MKTRSTSTSHRTVIKPTPASPIPVYPISLCESEPLYPLNLCVPPSSETNAKRIQEILDLQVDYVDQRCLVCTPIIQILSSLTVLFLSPPPMTGVPGSLRLHSMS